MSTRRLDAGLRGSGRYFTLKTEALEALHDARVPQYREMRDRIVAWEEAARALRCEVAALTWPQAAPKLLALSRNAEERRQTAEALRYARLAVEADGRSVEALCALGAYPLPDFVLMSVRARLVRLAPDDKDAGARIAVLQERYGVAPGKQPQRRRTVAGRRRDSLRSVPSGGCAISSETAWPPGYPACT